MSQDEGALPGAVPEDRIVTGFPRTGGGHYQITPKAWADWFRETQGREPVDDDYWHAVADGLIVQEGRTPEKISFLPPPPPPAPTAAIPQQQPAQAQQQPQPMPAGVWAQWFRDTAHREPGLYDYLQAQAAGWIAEERQQAPGTTAKPFLEQVGADLRQFASGVVPAGRAAVGVASGVAGTARASRFGFAPLAMVGAGLIGFISAFLPVVSAMGMSDGYFGSDANAYDSSAAGTGVFLIVLFLAVMAAGILAAVFAAAWSRILCGVLGCLAGLIAMLIGFSPLAAVAQADAPGAAIGAGPVLTLLASAAVLAMAVLCFVSLGRR